MNDAKITVATLATKVEADVIRLRLQEAGIDSDLTEGGQAGNGQPPLPTGFHVRTTEADFARAMGALFPIPDLDASAETRPAGDPAGAVTAWTCAGCGEMVFGDSQACWSCGRPRDRATAPTPVLWPRPGSASAISPIPLPPRSGPSGPPRDIPPIPGAPEAPFGVPAGLTFPGMLAPWHDRPRAEGSPRAAPAAPQGGATQAPTAAATESPRIQVPFVKPRGVFASAARKAAPAGNRVLPIDTTAGDQAARRAWYAALIGLALCPLLVGPVVNFYSLCVLLDVGRKNWRMSGHGNRMYFAALAVDAALFVATGYALSRL